MMLDLWDILYFTFLTFVIDLSISVYYPLRNFVRWKQKNFKSATS
jgi:hypothetical protein